MKAWGLKQFKLNSYVIPNTDSDVRIETTEFVSTYNPNNKRPAKSLYYKDKLIMSFTTDGYSVFTYQEDAQEAYNLGLLSRVPTNVNIASSIIDSLYYMYNPKEVEKAGGVIKVATIKALYSRLKNDDVMYSTFTQKIIDCFKRHAIEKVKRNGFSEEDRILFNMELTKEIKNCGLWSRLRICVLSGAWIRTHRSRNRILDNMEVAVHYDISAEEYGLHSESNYLLWPDQYVWNRVVYSREAGTVNCPCCNTTVPSQAFNTETNECIKCESRHYEIHNYSTRVPSLLKFKAKKVSTDTLYLGCELEFETTDRESARLKVGKALKDHAIMKSDGSIRNGFEVVTCPATLDIQLEVFSKFYADLPGELRNATNVGMHVHVSRKPLSLLTVGKLTAFMNNVNNKKFIEYVAGRNSNGYCNLDASRTVTYPWTHQNGGARYNTLNLTNRETIEFRIFSTPLTFQEFASKVQFCQALVDYCKPANLSLSIKDVINFKNFIAWLTPRRKDYPELITSLKGFA